MARVSRKVYDWTPKKGKGKSIMEIYDAIEGNKDTLFDIYLTHKAWGEDWYRLVRLNSYENAKAVLISRKKAQGIFFLIALNCIDDLIHLESEMREKEE